MVATGNNLSAEQRGCLNQVDARFAAFHGEYDAVRARCIQGVWEHNCAMDVVHERMGAYLEETYGWPQFGWDVGLKELAAVVGSLRDLAFRNHPENTAAHRHRVRRGGG
jgi:hypothetical protein